MTMQLRILDQIYPFMSSVAISATSEDPEFPASNLARPFRSKVWRSSGFFEIGASNCKIDFKESSGGSQKTATLTLGNYAPAALATEIAAQMTAAGTVAYTAAFDVATGLWSITSPGAYLSLLWSTGTNSVSSVGPTLGFSALSDQSGALSYSGAGIAIHTSEAVTFDLGTVSPVDSVCVLFDPSTPINLSAGASLRIQAGPTQNWSAPPVDQVLAIDEDFAAAVYFFTAAQNYRYWRLKVVDPGNADLFIEIPKVILAGATQLTRLPDRGFKLSQMDTSKADRTPYGHEYIDRYPSMRTLSISYAGMAYADAKALSKLFTRIGTSKPVLAVLDPLAGSFTPAHFLVYGKLSGSGDLGNLAGPFFSSSLQINEANG